VNPIETVSLFTWHTPADHDLLVNLGFGRSSSRGSERRAPHVYLSEEAEEGGIGRESSSDQCPAQNFGHAVVLDGKIADISGLGKGLGFYGAAVTCRNADATPYPEDWNHLAKND
jgi:hypothetical protein